LAYQGLVRETACAIVDKLKRGEPPTNPDKIVHAQVAADMK